MTKIEWFDLLVDLEPAQRAQKLAEIRATDADLAAQLTRLLAQDAASADAPDALETQLGDQLNLAIAQTVQARTQIGSYRLLGLLGQGGMGEVWRAERDVAGNKQPLALKILKLEDMSTEAHARFALEQRTLLRLVHPNIARLLDAGVATDGRPWIAMELVEGMPITEYCDQHQLSINARLALFRQVIAAVQYAHDYFIVHRDIKPDNVLVDSAGIVKLLDFGIAKSLDRHAPHTLTQQRFFSLYATAPEQLLGSSVCVGTDVYALGGLLYELLSGAPLISRELKTPAQLQSFIVEKTPTLPSRNIDASAASNRSAASIAKLSANLAGDLDRIVLHALRKLPSERYASAREFDEDIQAFLEHRPVKAAGQGRRYRTMKFLRRRWLVASISGLALASLLTLTVLLGWRGNQLQRANAVAQEQQKRAEAAKITADDARVAAESVNSFLIDVFKRADPLARERGEKGLSVVIDASFAEIRNANKFDSANAPVLLALVKGLISLGKTKQAGPLLVEIEEKIVLSDSQKIQSSFLGGEIARAELDSTALQIRIVQLQSYASSALSATQQRFLLTLQITQASIDDQHAQVVSMTQREDLDINEWRLRVKSLLHSKQYVVAQETVDAWEKAHVIEKIDQPFLLRTKFTLADFSEQRLAALDYAKRALAVAIEVFGPAHPDLLNYRNTLAGAYMRVGEFALALAKHQENYAQAKRTWKPDDERFGFLTYNMAMCEAKLGQLTDAGHQRLTFEAGKSLSRITLGARLALARDDFLNYRTASFKIRMQRIWAENTERDMVPELRFWLSIYDQKDQASLDWQALRLVVVKFDPILRARFAAKVKVASTRQ